MSKAFRETKGESRGTRKILARFARKAAHPPRNRNAISTLPSREGGKKGKRHE